MKQLIRKYKNGNNIEKYFTTIKDFPIELPIPTNFNNNFNLADLFINKTFDIKSEPFDIQVIDRPMLKSQPFDIQVEAPIYKKYIGNDIIDFFINKGLTEQQARGIYGNLMQESSGKLNAISFDGKGSYGLAQWTGDRKERLFAKYGKNPNRLQQLEYLWEELNTTEKKALDKLRKASTVEEATEVFMNEFERPNKKYANLERRIRYANLG